MFREGHGKGRVFSRRFIEDVSRERPRTLSAKYLGRGDPRRVHDSNGNGLLHIGASYGGPGLLIHLLQAGCPVNEQNKYGNTPLINSARKGNHVAALVLMLRGADYRLLNRRGQGPLHFCRESRKRQVVEILTRKMRSDGVDLREIARMLIDADCPTYVAAWTGIVHVLRTVCLHRRRPDETDELGCSALDVAMSRQDPEMILCLAAFGAVRCKSLDGASVLHWAVSSASPMHQGVLERLLLIGVDVDLVDENNGRTALHAAIAGGNVEAVRTLLLHGPDANARDLMGSAAIHVAVESGNETILRLVCGADRLDVNAKNRNGDTPLHIAVESSNIKFIEILLDHGADATIEGCEGKSMLHIAVEKRSKHLLKIFCDPKLKIDINGKKLGGYTPIHYATLLSSISCVKILLDSGADLNVTNSSGDNVLHTAILRNDKEIFELLLNTDEVCVDAKNNFGRTPLHDAAEWFTYFFVKNLLERGAEVNAQNDLQFTPLRLLILAHNDTMQENRDSEKEMVVRLLLRYGADIVGSDSVGLSFLRYVDELNLIQTFIRHVCIRERLNRPIGDAMQLVQDESHVEYYRECKLELDKMGRERIANGPVTYFDVLVGSRNKVASYLQNQKLAWALELGNNRKKFPLYWLDLEESFRDGRDRHQFLAKARPELEYVLRCSIPEITEPILSYLRNYDLDTLSSL